MGNSHFKSHILPETGKKVNISGFATITSATVVATNLVVGTSMTAKTLVTTANYIRIGASKYIFASTKNTAASLPAEATALVGATILGSIVLAGNGVYRFTSNSVASILDVT